MNLPEKVIVRQILGYLKRICQAAGKVKTMGVRRNNQWCRDPYLFLGFPDICGFKDNKIFFVEVKKKGNRQTPYQKSFQELCQNAGLTYILAYDLEDVREVIK